MTDAEDSITIETVTPAPVEVGAPRVRVFLTQSALETMNRHAADEPQHEIGGIMVGSVAQDTQTFVIIEAVIPGQHMSHTRGSVTFTHESWAEINRELDSKYPDKRIVGWYHSHPGFGIFLSDYDLFIHRNFFAAPWQVAFVTDPKAGTCGLFTWQDGNLQLDADSQVFSWTLATPGEAETPTSDPPPLAAVPMAQAPPATLPLTGILWALGLLAVAVAVVGALTLSTFSTATRTQAAVAALRADVQGLAASVQGATTAPPGPGTASVLPPADTGSPSAAPTGPDQPTTADRDNSPTSGPASPIQGQPPDATTAPGS